MTRIIAQEDINFLLTNRLPRRLATQFVGWFSKIENPLVTRASIAVLRMFTELDLSDAATTQFASLHACFTRGLVAGARRPDPRPDMLVSPCDAIIGACGVIDGERLYQVKGFPYTLTDLLGDAVTVDNFRSGRFVTLRLTASMYHRFHAPFDLVVNKVTYFSGDTWNVNPIALKRVEKLFCRNERAVIHARLEPSGHPILLVAVAAILVASIRLHFLDAERHVRELAKADATDPRRSQAGDGYGTSGSMRQIACHCRLSKGQEMGWFEHGSTIIVFTPDRFNLAAGVREGARIKAGQAIMHMPSTERSDRPIPEIPVVTTR